MGKCWRGTSYWFQESIKCNVQRSSHQRFLLEAHDRVEASFLSERRQPLIDPARFARYADQRCRKRRQRAKQDLHLYRAKSINVNRRPRIVALTGASARGCAAHASIQVQALKHICNTCGRAHALAFSGFVIQGKDQVMRALLVDSERNLLMDIKNWWGTSDSGPGCLVEKMLKAHTSLP